MASDDDVRLLEGEARRALGRLRKARRLVEAMADQREISQEVAEALLVHLRAPEDEG